jgi:hypothetical protein
MQAGQWVVTNDAVAFDVAGHLVNGQHRLLAVIESGVTISQLVAHDLPLDAQDHMDQGKRRNDGDVFSIHGFSDGRGMATIAGAVLGYLTYGDFATSKMRSARTPISVQDKRAFAEQQEEALRQSITAATQIRIRGMFKATMGAVHWAIAQEFAEEAGTFFSLVASGANLETNNPIYRLRVRLFDHAMGRHRLTENEMAALTIKAFNAWQAGDVLQSLIWRSSNEAFPAIGRVTDDQARMRRRALRRRERAVDGGDSSA